MSDFERYGWEPDGSREEVIVEYGRLKFNTPPVDMAAYTATITKATPMGALGTEAIVRLG